jgi:hypothetical protein
MRDASSHLTIFLRTTTMKPKKKDLDGIILNHIVMKLESEKANNSGKLPYGAITQIATDSNYGLLR